MFDLSKRLELLFDNQILQTILRTRIYLLDYWGASIYVYLIFHATAVASDEHFFRCLIYIDMNMVRASVVEHPAEWAHGGYREIQHPPKRYRIIDIPALMELGRFNDIETMQQQLRQWLNEELEINNSMRDKAWSESLAVGSERFVEKIQTLLDTKATNRKVTEMADKHALREQSASYNIASSTENTSLRLDNRFLWDDL
jgi:putative transposase